jgi:hypothetical protein
VVSPDTGNPHISDTRSFFGMILWIALGAVVVGVSLLVKMRSR